MKKILVVFTLLASPSAAQEPTWASIVEKMLDKSVVQLGANCSGFVIDSNRDYVLTAKHCGPEDPDDTIIVDLLPGKVIATDVHKDLTVIHVPGIDRPALRLAKGETQFGELVGSFGFGMGLERPMLRISNIAQPRALVPDAGPGEWVMVHASFVGGQSGGPVVNAKGEVVMIVQMSSVHLGLGRSAEEIKKRVGKFFEKVPE